LLRAAPVRAPSSARRPSPPAHGSATGSPFPGFAQGAGADFPAGSLLPAAASPAPPSGAAQIRARRPRLPPARPPLPAGARRRDLQGRRGTRFQLEELLRASAEMVGRGSLGTVYRAVLSEGCMVAVKRLRDANPCARDEFHRYMDLIGRLRHPHLVPLRAFHYARQEMLLIYDYLPNGNLHDRLHSHKMSGESALDWTTRVRLLLSATRGLACIHREYRTSGVPHDNVKSTNVLLDKDGATRVADFGLALLLSPTHAIARLGCYTAPEQQDDKRLSQEADVYSFGVLVLEALTGKAPAQHPQPDACKKGATTTSLSLPGARRSASSPMAAAVSSWLPAATTSPRSPAKLRIHAARRLSPIFRASRWGRARTAPLLGSLSSPSLRPLHVHPPLRCVLRRHPPTCRPPHRAGHLLTAHADAQQRLTLRASPVTGAVNTPC
jgi:serine/threonine protein kinase